MGRGTATFDGLSLAWATLEHLHAKVGARTLFATHYHELTLLAEQLPGLKNLRVAVKETSKGIVFGSFLDRDAQVFQPWRLFRPAASARGSGSRTVPSATLACRC